MQEVSNVIFICLECIRRKRGFPEFLSHGKPIHVVGNHGCNNFPSKGMLHEFRLVTLPGLFREIKRGLRMRGVF